MYTVSTGGIGQAQDCNQTINALQRSVGMVEVGNWYLQAGGYATSARVSEYIRTTSQGATPASIAMDQSIQAASNINFPTTDTLNQYGVHLSATTTGVNTNCKV